MLFLSGWLATAQPTSAQIKSQLTNSEFQLIAVYYSSVGIALWNCYEPHFRQL